MLVGSVVIGPLIDLAGPRAATVILTLVSVALLIICMPRLRRMEDVLGVRVFSRQVPVLASLPHRVLDDFASRVRLEKIPAGTDIVSQGERGYILKEGEAEVSARREEGQEIGRSPPTLPAAWPSGKKISPAWWCFILSAEVVTTLNRCYGATTIKSN
jgi:hypothetical protein